MARRAVKKAKVQEKRHNDSRKKELDELHSKAAARDAKRAFKQQKALVRNATSSSPTAAGSEGRVAAAAAAASTLAASLDRIPGCQHHQPSVVPVKGCHQCNIIRVAQELAKEKAALEGRVAALEAKLRSATTAAPPSATAVPSPQQTQTQVDADSNGTQRVVVSAESSEPTFTLPTNIDWTKHVALCCSGGDDGDVAASPVAVDAISSFSGLLKDLIGEAEEEEEGEGEEEVGGADGDAPTTTTTVTATTAHRMIPVPGASAAQLRLVCDFATRIFEQPPAVEGFSHLLLQCDGDGGGGGGDGGSSSATSGGSAGTVKGTPAAAASTPSSSSGSRLDLSVEAKLESWQLEWLEELLALADEEEQAAPPAAHQASAPRNKKHTKNKKDGTNSRNNKHHDPAASPTGISPIPAVGVSTADNNKCVHHLRCMMSMLNVANFLDAPTLLDLLATVIAGRFIRTFRYAKGQQQPTASFFGIDLARWSLVALSKSQKQRAKEQRKKNCSCVFPDGRNKKATLVCDACLLLRRNNDVKASQDVAGSGFASTPTFTDPFASDSTDLVRNVVELVLESSVAASPVSGVGNAGLTDAEFDVMCDAIIGTPSLLSAAAAADSIWLPTKQDGFCMAVDSLLKRCSDNTMLLVRKRLDIDPSTLVCLPFREWGKAVHYFADCLQRVQLETDILCEWSSVNIKKIVCSLPRIKTCQFVFDNTFDDCDDAMYDTALSTYDDNCRRVVWQVRRIFREHPNRALGLEVLVPDWKAPSLSNLRCYTNWHEEDDDGKEGSASGAVSAVDDDDDDGGEEDASPTTKAIDDATTEDDDVGAAAKTKKSTTDIDVYPPFESVIAGGGRQAGTSYHLPSVCDNHHPLVAVKLSKKSLCTLCMGNGGDGGTIAPDLFVDELSMMSCAPCDYHVCPFCQNLNPEFA